MSERLSIFSLFVKDNCKACKGMVEQASRFAVDYGLSYKIYNNSTEVTHAPAVRYCEFLIIGNKAFEKLVFLIKEKREGRI